ncbi:hypothetical protein HHI36_014642 [Cryptolaemus montrouzieri]|uniref:Reverse transcriptase Ty1/copia-type domain-containing protein n=1 Tax=Cryptolaemus montrouzieri TaxID=559131 RepID=A0ABD2N3L7_9CUCU
MQYDLKTAFLYGHLQEEIYTSRRSQMPIKHGMQAHKIFKFVVVVALSALKELFDVTLSEVNNYVGLEITKQNDSTLFLTLLNYIKQIVKRFVLEQANSVSTPEDPQTNLTAETGIFLAEGEVMST